MLRLYRFHKGVLLVCSSSLSSFFNPTTGLTFSTAISCSSGTASLEKISIGPKKSKGPGFFAALAVPATRVPPSFVHRTICVKTHRIPLFKGIHGMGTNGIFTYMLVDFISEILGKYKPFRPMNPYGHHFLPKVHHNSTKCKLRLLAHWHFAIAFGGARGKRRCPQHQLQGVPSYQNYRWLVILVPHPSEKDVQSSKWMIYPGIRGENFKKIFDLQKPPRLASQQQLSIPETSPLKCHF